MGSEGRKAGEEGYKEERREAAKRRKERSRFASAASRSG